jgi:hypothetical protein
MLAAVKRVVKEGWVHSLVARDVEEAFAQCKACRWWPCGTA